MSENNEKEFKYTFISPESLLSEEGSLEVREKKEKEEKVLQEERVIEPSFEEKKEEIKVKAGRMKIETPQEKFGVLEIKEEKKEIPLESFAFRQEVEPPKEFYLKPKVKPEDLETQEAPSKHFNILPYLKYSLILLFSISLIFSFFYFKPYKILLERFSKPKEVAKEEAREEPIILPEVREETKEKVEEVKKEEIKEEIKEEPLQPIKEPQEETKVSLETSESVFRVIFFPKKEIVLSSLSENELSSKLKEILNKYENPDIFYILEIKKENLYLPANFVLNYFFKNYLKGYENILGPNYNLLLYHSFSRKNFYIILETKNPDEAKKLNLSWKKNFNLKNLVNFYPEFTPTKSLSKGFISKKIGNIEYRELPLENNYSFLWLVYNKYVIYGNSEKGLEKLISFFSYLK